MRNKVCKEFYFVQFYRYSQIREIYMSDPYFFRTMHKEHIYKRKIILLTCRKTYIIYKQYFYEESVA